ncbi:MAG: small ribosomal subunit Rsm22 family protein [Blastocatellia bacterium]
MRLPAILQSAIESEASRHGFSSLVNAAAELSENYRLRERPAGHFITSDAHRIAYLAVRLPATFAAISAVFAELRRRMPELKIESLLDLGAGPGTAAWVAAESFPELRRVTLIEQDSELIRLGRRLAQQSEHAALREAEWLALDFKTAVPQPPHDLVVCSCTLGESDETAARRVMKTAWQATAQAIAIIEPGTVKGFRLIRTLRDELIQSGAHLVAPCPHQQQCPLTEADWCHFAQRFERSTLHRRLKGAELGYEDEKYSYLVAARQPVPTAAARVLRHPLRYAGYTQLQLCTSEGLMDLKVTRRDKEAWKRARKTDWGDEWVGSQEMEHG